MDLPSVAPETEWPCISAGHLPAPEVVPTHPWAPSLAVPHCVPVNHRQIEGDT